MAPRPPFPLFSQIAKKVFFNDEGLLKDMLSLTLTLGWKNEKRPSGPIELDLEAGNLVISLKLSCYVGRKLGLNVVTEEIALVPFRW